MLFFNELKKMLQQDKVVEDEWYLVKFIDKNITPLNSEQAFSLISDVARLVELETEPENAYDLLYIIKALKLKADTNETLDVINNDFFSSINKNFKEEYILDIVDEVKICFNFIE